ncbi:MAG: polysaccharide deacetylase family protein [Bacteroidia bacterium]|nr:polysaccharide deacetylase family protein [Bacteroidia bacterium]
MYRFKVPDILPTLMPGFLWRVATTEPVLYLTFDDGPHPEMTSFVLDTLKQFNAKATFFCVGENVQKYPEIYHRILAENHSVGNHTFNHLNGWKTPLTQYLENTNRAAEVIKSNLFRPPYGRITPTQARHLRKKYTLVMWDILSRDYERGLSLKSSLNAIKTGSRPGSVLVFHDSEKTALNLKSLLPETLSYFHEKGYRFDALKV